MSLPPVLARRIGQALDLREAPDFADEPDRLPAIAGAYLLAIRVGEDVPLGLPRLGNPVLASGWYFYCGSARGPGGIRARVARHMKRDKVLRWHVDRLTVAAVERHAIAFADASECDLVARLLRAGCTVPVPGLGSSDCRRCESHLLRC